MIIASFVVLSLGAVAFLIRMLLGPTVADRMVAVDGVLAVVICGILLGVAQTDSILTIDSVIVVALVAFVATGVIGRYIENRGEDNVGDGSER
jgi:multicomponent Na+:H+ antiporter subunit F